jgi:hypothetical protein
MASNGTFTVQRVSRPEPTSHTALTRLASTTHFGPSMIWVHGPRYLQAMYPDHQTRPYRPAL